MIVRHQHDASVYVIEFPEGSRARRSQVDGEGVIFIPTEEGEIPVFEVAGELMVELSRAGEYGLRLLGIEEMPEAC